MNRDPLRRPVVLLVAAFVLASCGSGPRSAAEVARDLNRASCDSLATCTGDVGDADSLDVALGLAHACREIDPYEEELVAILGRGHVRVDEARAAQCRADYLACRYLSPACRLVFSGTLADGAACIDGVECASGNCSGNRSSGTCGSCEPAIGTRVGLGEPCAADSECRSRAKSSSAPRSARSA